MLTKVFPFLAWFKDYKMSALRADAISGLTVALVLIPQSMAYAQLAGLPAYYGLYASFLPPMVAALFGSSRQLATGPVAVVSLMTAASLEPLATAGSASYIAYAVLLAVMVGLFQFLLGVLRLGLVVNFLSHPVVNGFTNAAALIIATSQLSKMFGVSVDTAEHHYETIINVVQSAFHYTHLPTLLLGLLAFAIMFFLKRTYPRIPNVLVAVVVTTLISWGIGFNHDEKVNISAIKDLSALQSISEFNQAVKKVEVLAEERLAVVSRLDAAKASGDIEAMHGAEYDLNILTARTQKLKFSAAHHRALLRNLLLARVEQDGVASFYAEGNTPADTENDGRTWRISVGAAVLNTESLKMVGGGAVVGSVPSGLPGFAMPQLDVKALLSMLPFAMVIALLGFMEAISIAKAMAAKTGQRLDPNQELIGQGLANMLGACFQSYTVSGSFSRSAVNLQAGAVTGMSSVFTSLIVVLALLFFTPLLYHLPQSVLAAVIMMAVIGLINASGFVHAWHAKKYDGIISITAFICTLAFAPHLDKGIMVGVVLSLGVFLYKSMRPTVATLSRSYDTSLCDAKLGNLRTCKYLSVIRFDGPLFFANASFLEDQVTERMINMPDLRQIIIVANGINDMDASGEEALSLVIDRVRSNSISIAFAGFNESVMAVLHRTHLYEKIGEENIYDTVDEALCETHTYAHSDIDEEDCPLTTFCKLS